MTTNSGAPCIRVGDSLDPAAFAALRRTMMLSHCKWDSQVGDVTTLAPFPLVINRTLWTQLAAWAEALSRELISIERELLRRPELISELGLPKNLVLIFQSGAPATPSAARVVRYDFHCTANGWQISEINGDVPGGYCEASSFSQLVAAHYLNLKPCGDPTVALTDSLVKQHNGGVIALLSAPGFMEDHQIVTYISQVLRSIGVRACLANPNQLHWIDRCAYLQLGEQRQPVDSIIRFYQAEWLAKLPSKTQWQFLFSNGATPVSNTGFSAMSESKRLPILFKRLDLDLSHCRQFFPESHDPRGVDWYDADAWIVKSAMSNNGDTVGSRDLLSSAQWAKVEREVRRHPEQWVAQRRFVSSKLDTPLGPAFPCIGVYTVDGKSAGAYARISTKPIVDYTAVDIALLIGE